MSDHADDEEHGPGRQSTGRIAYGQIQALNLLANADSLAKAVVQGVRVKHYNREWIVGRIHHAGHVLHGRVGFESIEQAVRWDSEELDFAPIRHEQATTSPFAIDLERLVVVFQTRGQRIKPQSFIGALQALLNAADADARWRVSQLEQEQTFEQWVARVRRVTRARLKVKRPNPNYHGANKVEELVEGWDAQVATVTAKARPDAPDGLDTDDEFFKQLMAHVQRDYGDAVLDGEDDDGNPTTFDTRRNKSETVVEVDPETHEVQPDVLFEHLADDLD